jgi:hypothetical protein
VDVLDVIYDHGIGTNNPATGLLLACRQIYFEFIPLAAERQVFAVLQRETYFGYGAEGRSVPIPLSNTIFRSDNWDTARGWHVGQPTQLRKRNPHEMADMWAVATRRHETVYQKRDGPSSSTMWAQLGEPAEPLVPLKLIQRVALYSRQGPDRMGEGLIPSEVLGVRCLGFAPKELFINLCTCHKSDRPEYRLFIFLKQVCRHLPSVERVGVLYCEDFQDGNEDEILLGHRQPNDLSPFQFPAGWNIVTRHHPVLQHMLHRGAAWRVTFDLPETKSIDVELRGRRCRVYPSIDRQPHKFCLFERDARTAGALSRPNDHRWWPHTVDLRVPTSRD